ncbi:trypsin-like peptidase domain-containing protein [Buchnera aphidicola (Chaitoregma tattakana)]|uniref:trypsin-like peptidase domain-containing protein n=1 Tax=Buchnera aphidicola TaxID=9 RepID=UPI0031B810AA
MFSLVNIKKFFIYFLFFSVSTFFLKPVSCCESHSYNIYHVSYPSLSNIIEKAMPSIVSIDAEGTKLFHKKKHEKTYYKNFKRSHKYKVNDDLEKRYFNSLGSGVIIDSKNGYVVTNSHVINDSYDIQVKLNDGRIFQSEVVGMDNNSDIAVIKLKDAKDLISMKFSDSDYVNVGDYVIALGNPYGLGNTATYGIVSAIGRSGLNIENYENFIQTDAAINKGSSGGALINLQGNLVGLNTAILSPKGGNIGIGFSIPSNMVKNLINQIIKYGKVQKKELGIIGVELNEEISNLINLKITKGIFVSEVVHNSLAEKFGIKSKDIIISMNDKLINNFLSFKAEIYSMPLDKEVKLKIIRSGEIKYFFIKMYDVDSCDSYNLGLYNKIPGLLISVSKKDSNNVLRIEHVKINSYAYKVGFRKNDIIVNINNNIIYDLTKLDYIVSKKNSLSIFCIKRDNNDIYIFIRF